jgi:hypothetical protein
VPNLGRFFVNKNCKNAGWGMGWGMRKCLFISIMYGARAARARGSEGTIQQPASQPAEGTIQQPASVSLSSNLLDGFAVETVENLSKISVYTVCVRSTQCVYRFIVFCIQCVYTLQINSGASKNVHPSHHDDSRECAAVENARQFSIV